MSNCKLSGKGLVVQLTRDTLRVALTQLGNAEGNLLHTVTFPMPAGAVEDGEIRDYPAVLALLKAAVSDPAFAKALRESAGAGVTVLAMDCAVTPDTMEVRLPVLVRL